MFFISTRKKLTMEKVTICFGVCIKKSPISILSLNVQHFSTFKRVFISFTDFTKIALDIVKNCQKQMTPKKKNNFIQIIIILLGN